MKVLIAHNSGNLGKSFIGREVFYQNFEGEDKMLLEIEGRNSSSEHFDIKVETIDFDHPDAMNTLTHYGIVYENLVLDVGSSEFKDFIKALDNSIEILDEFDLIIVPTIFDKKIIRDTHKTLAIFAFAGMEDKVRIVFNKSDPAVIEDNFRELISSAKKDGFKVDTDLYIKEYDAATDLLEENMLSGEILEDETDYKALCMKYHKEGDSEKSTDMSNMVLMRRISRSLNVAGKELYEKLKASIQ